MRRGAPPVALTSPCMEAVPSLGQVAVLALGGYLAIRHEISLGTFLAFSTYLTQLVAPARMLAGILTIGQQARAGVERIFQLLDLKPGSSMPPAAVELPPIMGEVVFDECRLSPTATLPPVLSGLELRRRPARPSLSWARAGAASRPWRTSCRGFTT